jgi:hypothetical protein
MANANESLHPKKRNKVKKKTMNSVVKIQKEARIVLNGRP